MFYFSFFGYDVWLSILVTPKLHYCNVIPLLYLRLAKAVFPKFTFFSDGQPLLASGGSLGVISIWNLEKRRLHSVIREAHDGSIVSLLRTNLFWWVQQLIIQSKLVPVFGFTSQLLYGRKLHALSTYPASPAVQSLGSCKPLHALSS